MTRLLLIALLKSCSLHPVYQKLLLPPPHPWQKKESTVRVFRSVGRRPWSSFAYFVRRSYFVSAVLLVSVLSFWWFRLRLFRLFRFGSFACFGGFVSLVSFRWFVLPFQVLVHAQKEFTKFSSSHGRRIFMYLIRILTLMPICFYLWQQVCLASGEIIQKVCCRIIMYRLKFIVSFTNYYVNKLLKMYSSLFRVYCSRNIWAVTLEQGIYVVNWSFQDPTWHILLRQCLQSLA